MISLQEMRDKEDGCGISKVKLMENAGKGFVEELKKIYVAGSKEGDLKDKKVLIISYHGNNGGDGFVISRYLTEICEVDLLFFGDESKLRPEGRENFLKIKDDFRIQMFMDPNGVDFGYYDIIIDAILGTGVKGEIQGTMSLVIKGINNTSGSGNKIVSVDIPSGLDPDTGIGELYVGADLIIAFHDIKKGLMRYEKKTVIVDIGIDK